MPIKCKIVFNTRQEMVEWILRQKGGPMGGLLGEEKGKPVYYSPGWFKKTPEVNTKAELSEMMDRAEAELEGSHCGECGTSTQGRKIRGLWNNALCEKCGDGYEDCEHCGCNHHYEDKCRY